MRRRAINGLWGDDIVPRSCIEGYLRPPSAAVPCHSIGVIGQNITIANTCSNCLLGNVPSFETRQFHFSNAWLLVSFTTLLFKKKGNFNNISMFYISIIVHSLDSFDKSIEYFVNTKCYSHRMNLSWTVVYCLSFEIVCLYYIILKIEFLFNTISTW